jgi:hypothetical protein
MMDREPKLRILLFSPAQQAIELVGRALPAVRPEPKFTDEYPLMAPVTIETFARGRGADRAGLGAAAGGLAMLGVAVIGAAKLGNRGAA